MGALGPPERKSLGRLRGGTFPENPESVAKILRGGPSRTLRFRKVTNKFSKFTRHAITTCMYKQMHELPDYNVKFWLQITDDVTGQVKHRMFAYFGSPVIMTLDELSGFSDTPDTSAHAWEGVNLSFPASRQ